MARRVQAVLLRERRGRNLLLVDDADAAWQALLDAGRPLELACVGVDALARLAAVPMKTHGGPPSLGRL